MTTYVQVADLQIGDTVELPAWRGMSEFVVAGFGGVDLAYAHKSNSIVTVEFAGPLEPDLKFAKFRDTDRVKLVRR